MSDTLELIQQRVAELVNETDADYAARWRRDQGLASATDLTMADFEGLLETGPGRNEVGHTGDLEELREYPCKCFTCRGSLSAVAPEHGAVFHDGEVEWVRCVFCSRFFDSLDVDSLSGGDDACERCAEGWLQRCRATGQNNEEPPPPGEVSVA